MTTTNSLNDVRTGRISSTSDRIAVIVLTPYSANKRQYGVQFWTKEMISVGAAMNTDNTVSTFIELF